MKSFLKYTLATIVGIMIVHVILFFIFIGFIGAIASFSEKTVTVKNNSILTIKLEGEILDRTSDNPLDNIDFLSFTPKKNLGLNKILASIQKAACRRQVRGAPAAIENPSSRRKCPRAFSCRLLPCTPARAGRGYPRRFFRGGTVS